MKLSMKIKLEISPFVSAGITAAYNYYIIKKIRS